MKSITAISPRVKHIVQTVTKQYRHADREMARWMSSNHVQVVAQQSAKLAKQHKANTEFVVVGALLHDFGDAWLDRSEPGYEDRSVREIRTALKNANFNQQESDQIITDIIAPHSCYPDNVPKTLGGKF